MKLLNIYGTICILSDENFYLSLCHHKIGKNKDGCQALRFSGILQNQFLAKIKDIYRSNFLHKYAFKHGSSINGT